MRQVTLTALRSMLAQQVQEVFLKCIEVYHVDLPSVLRFVNDRKDLVRTGVTYKAAGFKISLPDDEEDSIGTINLVIPLMTPNIVSDIRSTNTAFNVSLIVVRASTPDIVEVGPFEFESMSVAFDRHNATIALAFDRNIFEDAYPKDIFAPSNDPPIGVVIPPTTLYQLPEMGYVGQFTISRDYIYAGSWEPPLGGYTGAPLGVIAGGARVETLSEFVLDMNGGYIIAPEVM